MMRFFIVVTVLLSLVLKMDAQVKLTERFSELLFDSNMEFIIPVEHKYRTVKRAGASGYEPFDLAIYSRKEKIEIRFAIHPYEEEDLYSLAPHAACMRTVTHLASNDENSIISVLSLTPESLSSDFNADWGKVIVFKPKDQFSFATTCKLLVIHRENIGTSYTFFLFDKPSLELDNRFVSLRFKDESETF